MERRPAPRPPKREDDSSDGHSAVIGKDLIFHGEVGTKLACFLWENIFRCGCKLVDGQGQAAKEGRRLILNSVGGDVDCMCSIVDLFEEAWDLTTVATGSCMSAAVPIIAAGTPGKRYATWRTRFMLHPGWTCYVDPVEIESLDAELTEFKATDALYAEIMARYCHNPVSWWKRRLRQHKPWYFGPEKALELGIIDSIIHDKIVPAKRKRKP